jgi:hypothetical protein
VEREGRGTHEWLLVKAALILGGLVALGMAVPAVTDCDVTGSVMPLIPFVLAALGSVSLGVGAGVAAGRIGWAARVALGLAVAVVCAYSALRVMVLIHFEKCFDLPAL